MHGHLTCPEVFWHVSDTRIGTISNPVCVCVYVYVYVQLFDNLFYYIRTLPMKNYFQSISNCTHVELFCVSHTAF